MPSPFATLCIVTALSSTPFALAQEPEWPLEFDGGGAHVVLYQPQPEALKDDELTGRAAASIQRSDDAQPVFGALWLRARIATDRDARTVTVLDVEVQQCKLSGADRAQEAALAALVEDELSKQHHTFSLDRLLATLDDAVSSDADGSDLLHTPPRFVLVKEPTVLVTFDGAPKLQAIPGSRVMRAVNTPFVVLFDPAGASFYLQAGEDWLEAQRVEGPWRTAAHPPAEVLAALPARIVDAESGAQPAPSSSGACVLVATEPTELIVCDGEPTWTPLAENALLYLSNSENDVFLEVSSQRYFVLAAGRWYTSASLERGPWTYAASDDLPDDFAAIPPDSAKAAVRTFVAGTDEARDALLDASIPQTSVIQRSAARCTVSYDGEPRFETIQGTELTYAVNTSSSVIRAAGRYYCCSAGVWFVSDSALGPWMVCAQVPPGIDTIPPSSPLYPVRYVYVYDSTPEVVYVGYLPGYVGCYASGPTIVYGTGYSYAGWYGSTYYPRPCTWGYRPHYNAWTGGWSLGYGFGWGVDPGWFTMSVGWGHSGWWGPGGFGGSHFDVHGGHVRQHPNLPPPLEVDLAHRRSGRNNVYTQRENAARNRPLSPSPTTTARERAAGRTPNDVYADREGRVLRRTNEGWSERQKNGWGTPEPAPPVERATPRRSRPATPAPVVRPPTNPPRSDPRPDVPPRRDPPRRDPADAPSRGTPSPGAAPRPAAPPRPARPTPLPPRAEVERMHQQREQGNARASALERARSQAAPPTRKPRG